MCDRFRSLNRVLDPIHGLIQFGDSDFDRLILRLLDSRVMQRLRRIQQLGLTSLVYPGATHNRFSHSLGVFAVARQMTERLQRDGVGHDSIAEAERTQLAALLHDIGHGPFSHMFERAHSEKSTHEKRHEVWGRGLLSCAEITEIFDEFSRQEDLLALAEQSHLSNPYMRAVVSGTFDADRMDYLHRDQVMSGSFQGRFDWPWLMDNLEWEPVRKQIVLNHRAVHAAEEYLLARSHLYQTVYFHRTVRGAEGILERALRHFAKHCREGTLDDVAAGIPKDFPLRRWYSQETKDSEAIDSQIFLQLDDGLIFMMLYYVQHSTDNILRRASGLRHRQLHHCVEPFNQEKNKADQWYRTMEDGEIEQEWSVYVERLEFTPYEQHQPILIHQQGEGCVELSELSSIARALSEKITLLRFYSDDQHRLDKLRQHIASL